MSHSTTTHGGASHGSLKSYIIGFVLSVILTVIPFVMVMSGTASYTTTLLTVVGLAVVQIVVHLVYFLHMNTSSEETLESGGAPVHRYDYCNRCSGLTLDYVQPQHQYDG